MHVEKKVSKMSVNTFLLKKQEEYIGKNCSIKCPTDAGCFFK